MAGNSASYEELFRYGISYLPRIRNEKTGKINLHALNDYAPVITEFFDVLSELPSLPKDLADLATDLAIYANGESVQTDSYYQHLDPTANLEQALLAAAHQSRGLEFN